MKKYLIPALLVLTGYASLPHGALADQPKPPRCEPGQKGDDCRSPREAPPKDARKPDRKSSSAEPGRNAAPAQQGEARDRTPREKVPQPERQAQSAPDRSQAWSRGAKYTGKGTQVDYRRADLPAPGKDQQWVRDGDSYLLMSKRTGVIAQVRPR